MMWDWSVITASHPWFTVLSVLLIIWTLPWKGYALWLAAQNGQKWWFIALLIINALGILDIIYIFAIGRPELERRKAGVVSRSEQSGEKAVSSDSE